MTRLGIRRRDPVPWTWEPTGALILVVLMALAWVWVGADLVVDWITGAGIQDPINFAHIGDTLTSAPRLVVAAIGSILVLAATVVAVRSHLWARAAGWARTGFATPGQARASLGEQRLRSVASQIRPDLYPDRPSIRTRLRRWRR